MGHSAQYYYIGKDPTWALFCAVPFGLNARQQNAWFYEGGAQKLFEDFAKPSNVTGFLAGNTGCQMGGWFNKEIKEPGDFKGLKMRIGGWAGKVLQRLGGVPQQIAGGDIYPALEKGTLDACEWVGPYDDEKLGFYKVAPHYYAPGWWEGGSMLHAFVNIDKWNALPKQYQAVLEQAGHYANTWCMAKYDHLNPQALRRLLANGTKLHVFSQQIMDASYKATMELHAEVSKENAAFKKVNESLMDFTKNTYQWFQVAELSYDAYMTKVMRG
jgi:TRAP-type mannitol/chloroaromatic compound transport system substrate-binding protein